MQDYTRLYNIQAPPRHIPRLLKLQLLFGGFSSQFGGLFFGFPLIFVWVFTLHADFTGWYMFSGELQTVQGTIVSSQETKLSIGGDDDSDGVPVFKHSYRFTYKNQVYTGTSYRTGGGLIGQHQEVKIEFLKDRPEISRIQGMRRGVVGPLFGLVPILFCTVGLCFMVSGFQNGFNGIRLLRIGEQAKGVLISKEATKMQINDETVYKLTFEFSAIDGDTYQAVAKTHTTGFLEDEDAEPILYDPDCPERALLLDNLPGRPRIDEMGYISPVGTKALIALIVPVAALVGHAIYWFYWVK